MFANGPYISIEESLEFASKRRDLIKRALHSCEYYWNLLETELKRNTPRAINAKAAEDIIYWHNQFRQRYTGTVPLVVGAVAALRRNFLRLVAYILPDTGIDPPTVWDKTDEIIAENPDWKIAVEIALSDIDRVKEEIGRLHPAWEVTSETPLSVILDHIRKYDEQIIFRLLQANEAKPKKLLLQPLADSGYLRISADRINKATIEALTFGAINLIPSHLLEPIGINENFWGGHTFGFSGRALRRGQVVGIIGLRHKPEDHVWRFLLKNGAIAIKAQYALWARAYAKTSAEPGVYISLTISQFCDDIGFQRKKRAHTRRSKQAAITVLELLTELELVCVYRPPKGATQRIRGPIWSRGIISEELLGYKDLFHAGLNDKDNLWIPKAFSYAPGPFFENEAWRKYNHYIALVGQGLLKLRVDNADKYAVMVGGFLAILARMNGYETSRISVRTLLEKTGLWRVDRVKNPGRMHKKLENALERLCEVGVIRSWRITSPPSDIDANNLDDVSVLDKLSDPTRWQPESFSQMVIVDWPEEIQSRALKLSKKKEHHRKRATRKRIRKTPAV